MGWSLCGENRYGQETGYGVTAVCDEPGCNEQIDRGLGYLCGQPLGLHDHDYTCAKYYCHKHLDYAVVKDEDGEEHTVKVCVRCAVELEREVRDANHKPELHDRGDPSG